jgi:hypothetical protein
MLPRVNIAMKKTRRITTAMHTGHHTKAINPIAEGNTKYNK